MTERVRVREIDDDEGQRLVQIGRRGAGSVVTWRRARMVLLFAQGMDVPAIAKVAFTSEGRVRDVVQNFNADGFSSLYPKYRGGHSRPRRHSGSSDSSANMCTRPGRHSTASASSYSASRRLARHRYNLTAERRQHPARLLLPLLARISRPGHPESPGLLMS